MLVHVYLLLHFPAIFLHPSDFLSSVMCTHVCKYELWVEVLFSFGLWCGWEKLLVFQTIFDIFVVAIQEKWKQGNISVFVGKCICLILMESLAPHKLFVSFWWLLFLYMQREKVQFKEQNGDNLCWRPIYSSCTEAVTSSYFWRLKNNKSIWKFYSIRITWFTRRPRSSQIIDRGFRFQVEGIKS